MNNYGRPATTDAMQWQTEISILGLVKRLKEYAKTVESDSMGCDLEVAANLIDYFIRTSDDFK